ncbi:hypothetical protein EVAR_46271_1 [Eumeta japonica]|uniref:Uncharacterized protein n=1 Tax=Eumeta variegata TaxID=151549 RepID=A0A4C1Y642_EUMVA|nr:hypothetical protein EVAR_46271_1 [Eumeta japonica]
MAENRNTGEKKEGSRSVEPVHCIVRRQGGRVSFMRQEPRRRRIAGAYASRLFHDWTVPLWRKHRFFIVLTAERARRDEIPSRRQNTTSHDIIHVRVTCRASRRQNEHATEQQRNGAFVAGSKGHPEKSLECTTALKLENGTSTHRTR